MSLVNKPQFLFEGSNGLEEERENGRIEGVV